MLIVKLHLVHGNRWCDIAKQVDGRTDNAIKNRFNSNLSKRLKEPQFVNLFACNDFCGDEKSSESKEEQGTVEKSAPVVEQKL